MPNTRSTDGDLWAATIENVNDPALRRRIHVVISRSVVQSRREGMLGDVRQAVESDGRTAIERFLDLEEPPDRILVANTGIRASEKPA